jgi:uncharacterized membrane protein YbhN (UPF0104 family)
MTTPTDDLEMDVDAVADAGPSPHGGRHARHTHKGVDMSPPLVATPPSSLVTGRHQAPPSRTFRLPRVPSVAPRRFILPVVLGAGIWILATQLTGTSTFTAAFDHVAWIWVLVALLVTQLTVLSEAVSISGATTHEFPLGDLVRVQSATGLTGLLGGTVGAMATVIRFVRERGLDPALAYGSGALHTVAGVAVQLVLLVVFIPFALDQLHRTPAGPSGSGAEILQLLLYTVTAAGLVGGLDFAVPRVRRAWRNRHRTQFEPAWHNVDAVASHADNVFRLLAASAVTQLVLAAGLACTLHAVGAHTSLGGLILVTCFTSVVGGLAPVPGGIPVMEASYISGLTLIGVPQDQAVVATLLFRSCTTYLPALWGYAAWRSLRRQGAL